MTLIFLHLGQTGGSTFGKAIERQFKSGIYHVKGQEAALEKFKNLPKDRLAKIKFLWGHMPYGMHRYLTQPSSYITLLRDPVDKVIASYLRIKNTPGHPFYEPLQKMSIRDFALSNFHIAENDYTRFLIGSEQIYAEKQLAKDFRLTPLPPDALATALNTLKSFYLVGTNKRLEETLLILNKMLGRENLYFFERNAGAQFPQVDLKTRKIIEERNILDRRLFQFAESAINAQLTEPLLKETAKFKKYNKIFSAPLFLKEYSYKRIRSLGWRFAGHVPSHIRKLLR